MKENISQWKTTIIGIILSLLGLLQLFHVITAEQVTSLTSSIPMLGDKAVELITLILGLFMMFKARDAKKVTSKKIL